MTELRLRMNIFPTVEAVTWEFILLVEGFETEEQARIWLDAHRDTLVDESFLKMTKLR